ncbi:ROK family protein [Bifidobacterium cebidarum]|uniref:NagC family transcriptional regulator n=1 Tax=Bifidobacterium cebidarum TaxID=2650773 RepID=A0A6I1GDW1_9BIFI|nr:ROK family protein [Bifidobacterium cebidarum]KAB7787872.1 NagC family transcriptional regulator [Bifidobacterium cebidarum]
MSLFGAASPSNTQSAKSSPTDVRRSNRQLIFSLLFPTNQYSRADLGRLTGLSRVAVSDVVSQMLDEGLLRETGQAPSGGKGKRGTLLSIDIDRLNIVSLDLTQDHMLHGAVTNLLGQALRHAEITLGAGERVTLEMIGELIEKMMGMAEGTVIGIGIASPGVVDGGVVKRSTWLDWHDMDLSAPLQERFGANVTVTNDATAAMLAERFFGQGDRNMIFVRIESGIGSAILINDAPVKGEMHAAGEIGHISIDLNGPECPCGKRGCLETMISDHVLRKQLIHADQQQKVGILAQAGRHLGQALSMPVGLLDMADVCVYGQPDIVNATFINAAQQYLDASTSSTFHKHTVIRRCECGSDITVQGEAIAVLVHYLSQ